MKEGEVAKRMIELTTTRTEEARLGEPRRRVRADDAGVVGVGTPE